jgi:hypothetical protein
VPTGSFRTELQTILRDIIEGKIVKRSKHELRWETLDLSLEFIEALKNAGYKQMMVQNVEIKPGERVPAFFLENGAAYFGWVFWEKFSQLKLRKLFGSVIRNTKGDWAVQISDKRRSVIYVNPDLKSEMDIDNPSGF